MYKVIKHITTGLLGNALPFPQAIPLQPKTGTTNDSYTI